MKKEMKHALVALGLSTLLVPSFANQVVYAQEESHETVTQVTLEFFKNEVEQAKKSYKEFLSKNKEKLLNEADQVDWSILSFSQDDIKTIKNNAIERLNKEYQSFLEEIEGVEKEALETSKDFQGAVNRLHDSMSYRINTNFDSSYRIKREALELIILKKKEKLIPKIKENQYYTAREKENVLKSIESPIDFKQYYPEGDRDGNMTVNQYLKTLVPVASNDFRIYIVLPREKNIREIKAVAFIEKTAISSDDSLSKSDKLALLNNVEDILEEGLEQIGTHSVGYIPDNGNDIVNMLSPEELSVFTKRIEDVYQGKAKPKVTKEEAIQAVSTGTSSSVSTSSQATVTANGETKKDYQASKWFKESGKWYYNDLSGNLVRNRWVGRYYLKADASMAASEWIYDEDYKSWFYVDSTGSYVEKAWQGEYYLKRGGYMAKSEWVFDSQYDSWYYLNQDGKYARNQWIKDGDKWYYLLADGKLAKNMTINGYKVNEKGEWV